MYFFDPTKLDEDENNFWKPYELLRTPLGGPVSRSTLPIARELARLAGDASRKAKKIFRMQAPPDGVKVAIEIAEQLVEEVHAASEAIGSKLVLMKETEGAAEEVIQPIKSLCDRAAQRAATSAEAGRAFLAIHEPYLAGKALESAAMIVVRPLNTNLKLLCRADSEKERQCAQQTWAGVKRLPLFDQMSESTLFRFQSYSMQAGHCALLAASTMDIGSGIESSGELSRFAIINFMRAGRVPKKLVCVAKCTSNKVSAICFLYAAWWRTL